jgi:hypothetical protein
MPSHFICLSEYDLIAPYRLILPNSTGELVKFRNPPAPTPRRAGLTLIPVKDQLFPVLFEIMRSGRPFDVEQYLRNRNRGGQAA